jgi:hypothetical protein
MTRTTPIINVHHTYYLMTEITEGELLLLAHKCNQGGSDVKIDMGIGQITPIYSTSFLPKSYNPKAEVPISSAKPAAKQLTFFEVLSALVTDDNPHLEQITKAQLKTLLIYP